ncbi:MAG: sigma 54-interacting transcriptional regulator [Firmicutes bacterium]|nr:sigma 54-interacting transcriptional regulator [Bacillota bacterium]
MNNKKDMESLYFLLQDASDGICISDDKGKILYRNEAAKALACSAGEGADESQLFGLPLAAEVCSEEQHDSSYIKELPDGRTLSVYSVCIGADCENSCGNFIMSFLREAGLPEGDDINALQVYKGSAMAQVLSLATKLAKIDSPVLIAGESGTGKVMLAQYIHRSSAGRGGAFISFNCAAITGELLEEEFFGRAGSNGEMEKLGVIATAAGGTLFLDEIDALPIFIQTRLLYALHEKTYRPVGGRKGFPVECRIVAATDRDLNKMVANGEFREDLYYLIDVFEIKVPPIRERVMDIMPLIRYLAERYNKRYHLHRQITEAALEVLVEYSWPGNLREMDNTIERMIVMAPEDIIDVYHLPDNIRFQVVAESHTGKEQGSLDEAVEEVEGAIIRRAYEKYGSSYEVGRMLKISQSKASRLIRKYCTKK